MDKSLGDLLEMIKPRVKRPAGEGGGARQHAGVESLEMLTQSLLLSIVKQSLAERRPLPADLIDNAINLLAQVEGFMMGDGDGYILITKKRTAELDELFALLHKRPFKVSGGKLVQIKDPAFPSLIQWMARVDEFMINEERDDVERR